MVLKIKMGSEYSTKIICYQWPSLFRYSVGQYEDGFIFNLQVDICIPIDGDPFCIPDDGLKLLDNEKFPACSISGLMNISGEIDLLLVAGRMKV